MKKLILLFSVVILSCSTENSSVTQLTFNERYIGHWVGRDYGKTLDITEHTATIHTFTDVVYVTEGTQMAQTDFYNGIRLPDSSELDFHDWAYGAMIVTFTEEDGDLIIQDFYARE